MIWKISRGSLNVLYFEHTYFAKYKFRLYLWWSPLSLNCCFTHFFFSQIWQSRNSLAPPRKFLRRKSLFLALPKWTFSNKLWTLLFGSTLIFSREHQTAGLHFIWFIFTWHKLPTVVTKCHFSSDSLIVHYLLVESLSALRLSPRVCGSCEGRQNENQTQYSHHRGPAVIDTWGINNAKFFYYINHHHHHHHHLQIQSGSKTRIVCCIENLRQCYIRPSSYTCSTPHGCYTFPIDECSTWK